MFSRHHRDAVGRVALGALAVALIVTGCSSTSDGSGTSTRSDGVASVADPSRSSATSQAGQAAGASAARSSQAPQLRLDTTDRENLQMWQPYLHCLKAHHVPVSTAGATIKSASGAAITNPDPGLLWYSGEDLSKYPGVEKACSEKRPLPPPELDPKRNPDFMDNFRAQMDCMKRQGLKVDPNPDGSGWRLPEYTAETQKIAKDCEIKAFSGKAK